MPMSLGPLCEDLAAETADLVAILTSLDEPTWDRPTPAPGWSIRDQVTHLAYFDDVSTLGATDPERFRLEYASDLADVDGMVDRVTAAYRQLSGADTLAWLQQARSGFITAVSGLDPAVRVPWFGPAMTLASAVTSRIMETWAHGQDIADTVGATRPATNRLRHVAFLGARAVPNSYRSHGLPEPATGIRIEVTGPDGDRWTFGPEDATDVVRGPVLDFCLVVTQRRHPDDTDLRAEGPVATDWLSIAQAFAGPPGQGRQPGEFAGDGR
jgi:uncharacterized protein (TIGR03084 family)